MSAIVNICGTIGLSSIPTASVGYDYPTLVVDHMGAVHKQKQPDLLNLPRIEHLPGYTDTMQEALLKAGWLLGDGAKDLSQRDQLLVGLIAMVTELKR